MAPDRSIAHNRIIGDRIIERASRRGGKSAAILTFPIQLDRAFLVTIAGAMKRKRSADAAETFLAAELRRYIRQMRRKGIPSPLIKRQVHAMEPAIRGELWRLIFGPLSGEGPQR
jgi:uncharacterized protein DUF6074